MAPRVYRARRESLGRVVRLDELSVAEATAEYGTGGDVVVCGGTKSENRALAQQIAAAVGPYVRETPHKQAGQYVLPHFQPDPRPPHGHAFYETDKRKAARNP